MCSKAEILKHTEKIFILVVANQFSHKPCFFVFHTQCVSFQAIKAGHRSILDFNEAEWHF